MRSTGQIAVIGGFGIAMSMYARRAPDPGETVSGATFMLAMGGKGSNQAVAARRLGHDVAILTAVGGDDFGLMGLDLWREEGVDASGVATLPGATMVGTVITDETGENRILIADGVLAQAGGDVVTAFEPMLNRAVVVLVSCEISPAVVDAVLRATDGTAAVTILNPAPVIPLDPALVSAADIITPNEHEAVALLRQSGTTAVAPSGEDPAALAQALADAYRTTIVMTAGGDGVYVGHAGGPGDTAKFTATGGTHHRAVATPDVVDTTGAGDAFNGALAAALCEGATLEDAIGFANTCASMAVQVAGVIPALPRRSELPPELHSATGATTSEGQEPARG